VAANDGAVTRAGDPVSADLGHDVALPERLRLVVGCLDEADLADLRMWLRASISRPDALVEVDLGEHEQIYHYTVVVLLTATARRSRVHRSHLVVLNPPETMIASLTAAGLVSRGPWAGEAGDGATVVHIALGRGVWPPPARWKNWHQQVMLATTDGGWVPSGWCVCEQGWPCELPP
jgi:hypothetical protein